MRDEPAPPVRGRVASLDHDREALGELVPGVDLTTVEVPPGDAGVRVAGAAEDIPE